MNILSSHLKCSLLSDWLKTLSVVAKWTKRYLPAVTSGLNLTKQNGHEFRVRLV